jgi:hypothetical protein
MSMFTSLHKFARSITPPVKIVPISHLLTLSFVRTAIGMPEFLAALLLKRIVQQFYRIDVRCSRLALLPADRRPVISAHHVHAVTDKVELCFVTISHHRALWHP